MAPSFAVLTGPTAAGKTAWLIHRAQHRPMLVISADSRQVYRFMNIGTGKPAAADLRILPHWCIDCVNPGFDFSVHQFLIQAAFAMLKAESEQREVWVCGGTGLYIRALVEGLALGTAPRPQLREALGRRIRETGARQAAEALSLKLADADNPVRVIRAAENACADRERGAEIYGWAGLATGLSSSEGMTADGEFKRAQDVLSAWTCTGIAVLDPGRETLQSLIIHRVCGMFEHGLVEEVRELRRLGFGQAGVVADGIGYREAGQVLDGQISEREAVEAAVIRTRQYAKRQRTYFRGRNWPSVNQHELADISEQLVPET